jgi:hypothetical protein
VSKLVKGVFEGATYVCRDCVRRLKSIKDLSRHKIDIGRVVIYTRICVEVEWAIIHSRMILRMVVQD